jgi:hypothetical protein
VPDGDLLGRDELQLTRGSSAAEHGREEVTNMRRARQAILVLLAVALVAAGLPAAARAAHTTIGVDFFYDSLAPHGRWIASAEFGYVWRPAYVGGGWRPYWDGRWIYTDYGWTFFSDEPWGWATYHYGRWYFDPYYGWVWVPGYEWAPAWVVFHYGPGWVGWAPLPPRVSLSVAFSGQVRLDPRAYCFVEERHFVDRRISRHVVRADYNTRLLRSTRNITRFSRSGDHYVNRSLSVEPIRRATKRRIEAHRIVDVSGSRSARVARDEVRLFRPQVSRQRVSRVPKQVEQPPSRSERGRGATVDTERGGRGRPTATSRGDERGKQKQRGKPRDRDRRKPPAGWR